MNIPSVDLLDLHEAIKLGLELQFPGVNVLLGYERPGETLPVPCILIDLESIEPDGASQNTGTEQLDVQLSFSIEVVTSYKRGADGMSGKMSARILAAAVAAFVERNKWGLQSVTPGRFKGSHPESFYSRDSNYESWCVKWTHFAAVGENLWRECFPRLANGIWFGQAPKIGADHLADYKPVTVPLTGDFITPPPRPQS